MSVIITDIGLAFGLLMALYIIIKLVGLLKIEDSGKYPENGDSIPGEKSSNPGDGIINKIKKWLSHR